MDVIEYLKTEKRICGFYMKECQKCPLSHCNNGTDTGCGWFTKQEPEKCIEIMKKWTEEHPPKTRQSEFLKIFPNAELEEGVLMITPCIVDSTVKTDVCEINLIMCEECAKKYWGEEVD